MIIPLPENFKLPDHTGKTICGLKVVGYAGVYGPAYSDRGKIRNGSKRNFWVLECFCGAEFIRSHHDIARDLNREGRTPMCRSCAMAYRKFYRVDPRKK